MVKLVRAMVRAERLPFIQHALAERDIFAMTVFPVMGQGNQRGIHIQFRGGIFNVGLLPKVAIEIVVEDNLVELVIDRIVLAARLGKEGDGKIVILPVQESYRVRTGEVEV